MAKNITKKPSSWAWGMTWPARVNGTRTLNAKWQISDWQKSNENPERVEKIRAIWQFSKKTKKLKNYPTVVVDGNNGFLSSNLYLDNVKIGKTTYTRRSFYPFTSYKLWSAWVTVYYGNRYGWGKGVTGSIKFDKPRQPSLGAWSFNKENGVATINIKTNAGTDRFERYDTRYTLEVTNTRTGVKKKKHKDTSSTSTDFNVSFNVGDYQQLSYGQYVCLKLTAWARGYAGDSKKVSRTIYISYPAQATITKTAVSAKDSTGKCTVYIKTNSSTAHPVDRVKLEYLADVEYSIESDIPASADWKDSGIIDDSNCSALAVGVSELMPAKGHYTWVRVKSYHLSEEVLYRYSKPMRVKELEAPAPTAADDEIVLLDAHAGSDGKSAVAYLGWNADGQDDSDGTELSWSDELDTWKSTKDPDSYRFEWSDGPIYKLTEDTEIVEGKTYYERTGTGTDEAPFVYTVVDTPVVEDIGSYYEMEFRDSAVITIKGLQEGEKYYIKARRYKEGDRETYSPYTDTGSVVTSERPESIVAQCDRYIADGSPLTVRWTFSGNGIQKQWQIVTRSNKYTPTLDSVVYLPTEDEEIVEGKTYYALNEEDEFVEVENPVIEDIGTYFEKGGGVVEGKTYYSRSGTEGAYVYTEVAEPLDVELPNYYEASTGAVIANGDTTIGSTQISYERLQSLAENESLSFIVQASTGSEFVSSDVLTVSLIENPELSVSVPATLTVQPFSFTAQSNRTCDLIVIVSSKGISGQLPQGIEYQLNGDIVHSDVFTPEWEATDDTYTTTVELPSSLDFWDGGTYTISVTAVDRGTGLRSEVQETDFEIAWAHQAVNPLGFATVTPIDETDENGVHHIAARIELTPPTGASEDDVYDVYRMDGGNAQLIGADLPLTHTTVDEYAPYGDGETLYYRVAIRTVDGDTDYADVEYESEFKSIRFDWAEGYLELPYGIQIGDSYSKDVDIRQHLDGSMDGYWNQGITRKGTLSTSVIRLVQPREIEMARRLARYTGPVFVRTPNGSAYEADVQVTDLSVKNKAVTDVAFDATEVSITAEFQLPPIVSEEEQESEQESE